MSEWRVSILRRRRFALHAGDEVTARYLVGRMLDGEDAIPAGPEQVELEELVEVPPTMGTYETDGTIGPT